MNRRQNGHYREARFPAIPDRKSKKFISIPAENGAELISEIIKKLLTHHFPAEKVGAR